MHLDLITTYYYQKLKKNSKSVTFYVLVKILKSLYFFSARKNFLKVISDGQTYSLKVIC